MNLKKSILVVFSANIISLLFNLITNFVLPRYLSIDTYAYIKTFQFYLVYAGALHLGYNDGMYLKYGGKKVLNLDANDLSIDISTGRIFQLLISLILVFVSMKYDNSVLFLVAIVTLPYNMAWYFKLFYQAVGEFNKYGQAMNLTTFFTFATNMVLLFILKTDDYKVYLLTYAFINIIVWIVIEVKFYKYNHLKFEWRKFDFSVFLENIRKGFYLTCGNFSSNILTGMDRWFIKVLLTNQEFAPYSFAVSMENLLNVAVTPISITLYNFFCNAPSIKEIQEIRNRIMVFAAVIISCAFPAKFILENLLVNYMNSSRVMFFLFATQIFYIIIKSIYVNMYKAQGRQNIYFKKMILIIMIGFVINIISFFIYPYKESFAIATMITAGIWFCLSINDMCELTYTKKELCYPFLEIILFLICGYELNSILGFLVYCIMTYIITFIFMEETLTNIKYLLVSSIKKRS